MALPRIRYEELRVALTEAGFHCRDSQGRVSALTVEEMVRQEGERHLVTLEHGLTKVEIFFPFLPLQQSILQRAMPVRLGQREVSVTTAEDIVVLKMAFHREKDLTDIRGILWNQKGKLDLAYIRDWARKMISDEDCEELERLIRQYAGE
jgi:predicted nucleotidyltransferase